MTVSSSCTHTKVIENYQSTWTADIYSLVSAGEMVRCLHRHHGGRMTADDYMDDIDLRILRVTEDLRAIQRELNCAAMQAPADPELMESLSQLGEMESIQTLKSALDQMRHFLWFYMQIVGNESEMGEKLRQTLGQKPSHDAATPPEATVSEKIRYATDTVMMHYLADGKVRKPN
jgi:hypothetical protein